MTGCIRCGDTGSTDPRSLWHCTKCYLEVQEERCESVILDGLHNIPEMDWKQWRAYVKPGILRSRQYGLSIYAPSDSGEPALVNIIIGRLFRGFFSCGCPLGVIDYQIGKSKEEIKRAEKVIEALKKLRKEIQ